jgi:hypothetical protein
MCGPSGWPAHRTPWPAGPTLQPPMSFLSGDSLQEVVEWNSRPGVGGGRAPWPASNVARPAGQHLANYLKSVIAPGTPINIPLPMKFRTPHSTYSSPLVNVSV